MCAASTSGDGGRLCPRRRGTVVAEGGDEMAGGRDPEAARRRGTARGPGAARRRALVAGALALAFALATPAAPVAAVPAGHQSVTPAAASALAPGTIVNVAGSPGWGPSAATDTVMQPFSMARWGTTLFVADA